MVVHLERKEQQEFRSTESSMPDLKLFFIRTLLDWLFALWNLSLFFIVDFLELCNFCNWLFTLCTWVTSFLIYIYFITYKKKMVNFYSSLNLIENGEFN